MTNGPVLRFGRFELHPGSRRLLRDAQPAVIGARAFDVLMALVERADREVSKHELLELVWPGLVVEENNLQVQISSLRKLLGPEAITTIPGRGYRFTAALTSPATAALGVPEAVAPKASRRPHPPTNLSTWLPPLIGRDEDIRAIGALLQSHELVSVIGAGGIGKTRVAQAVASAVQGDFEDGVWSVELDAVSDPAMVANAVAQAMRIGVSADRPAAAALLSVLKPQRALLLLDSCEHLLGAVVHLVETLLPQCPNVRWLVTSQETLRLPMEQTYRLDGLAVSAPDEPARADAGAVALFKARALAADPRIRFDDANLPVVAAICRALDGIPLAIELAAARVPLLGVEGLRQRLGERLNLLTGGVRTVLRRHQTLRAALEWSHGLLDPDEQTVLRRLGVFAGGFALELAQAVVIDARIDRWAVLDLLGHLVDKSLVVVDSAEVPRYRLLETTRAFALEQLAAAGETAALLRRHAQALADYLEPQLTQYWTQSSADVVRGEVEFDNLRAALDWADSPGGDKALACVLMGVSGRLWRHSGQLLEGIERCRRLLPLPADLPLRAQARFHMVHCALGYIGSRFDCYASAGHAVRLFRSLGDESMLANALMTQAMVAAYRGATDEAGAALAEAQALLRPEWPAPQRAMLALAWSLWHISCDRCDLAMSAALQQADCRLEIGDAVGVQVARLNIGYYEGFLGAHDSAIMRLQAALTELRRLHATRGIGWALECLALVHALRGAPGDFDRTLAYAREAWPTRRRERRDMNLLLAIAMGLARQGVAVKAALLRGHVDAVWATEGAAVWPPYARLRTQTLEHIHAAIGAQWTAELMAKGAALDDQRAAALAFDDAPPEKPREGVLVNGSMGATAFGALAGAAPMPGVGRAREQCGE
jgi:predicted ATPase/DNA-binding winged helix-turn-helix (wHTH) protein